MKLTLVSFSCRGIEVSGFIMAPYINGKPIVSYSVIDHLFSTKAGFIPRRGETVSIG